MALCSQAFNRATKRSCNFGATQHQQSVSLSHSGSPQNKRVCLQTRSKPEAFAPAVYSSSENEINSDDEQSCYNADQVRAKRRASTRVSFSLNSELSKAISKYSDDEDTGSESHDNENIDCKLSSSPGAGGRKLLSISDSSSCGYVRNAIPNTDKEARSKCFEYLVGAIDEAWARYCDATTYVEDEVYGYNTPTSVATDDEDCFGNTTDITEYEDSDFELPHKHTSIAKKATTTGGKAVASGSSSSAAAIAITSKDPSSCQLQALKDRLTKAKYFLQDLVDSDDFNDANAFWKRWDMIKYATIELVDDDDDDEVIESTIDELEDGRLFIN